MGATEMTAKHDGKATIEGINGLNVSILGKAGEKFTIEDLDEMVFEFLGEAVNDYDLKLVRGAVAHQEAPLSFVWVFDWTGTAENLEGIFESAVLRHEWAIYKGEVYNSRRTYNDPFWRYVGKPIFVGRYDSEEQALDAYEAINPKLEWITDADSRHNGYLVEVDSYSYSPDGSLYSSGLVDSKVFYQQARRNGRRAAA